MARRYRMDAETRAHLHRWVEREFSAGRRSVEASIVRFLQSMESDEAESFLDEGWSVVWRDMQDVS